MRLSKRRFPIPLIIGLTLLVLAVFVALPAWRTHATQTHITEALKVADGAKLVVMEAATTRGGLERLTADDLAYNGDTARARYVARITVGAGGHITVATRDTGAAPDPVLELVPVEAASAQGPSPIAWRCVVVRGDTRAMPEDCRSQPTEAVGGPVPAASRGQ